jgi:hypothetical protein
MWINVVLYKNATQLFNQPQQGESLSIDEKIYKWFRFLVQKLK